MKTLSLVRHAKSSWKDPTLQDRDRPLNKRGKRDAPRMGKRLAAAGVRPDLVITSPALRARSTAQIIADEIGYEEQNIVEQERLYFTGPDGALSVVHELDDSLEHVMLVGHNPDFTELVNLLANTDIENVPTCGIAHIRFDVPSWCDITAGTGQLLAFDYPKRVED